VKSKTFILIAGALAAEQRAIVAHSASYGFNRPQTHQAPAGAKENYSSATQIVCRAIRRSKILEHYSHSARDRSGCPQISQVPGGATENRATKTHFFRPCRGLNRFADIVPTVSPWATIVRHSVADENRTATQL
jgi:hypothetical protein